jgi:hypothetical protein
MPKHEKNEILEALNGDDDRVYFKERVIKTEKREPELRDKNKKPIRNNNKKELWQ